MRRIFGGARYANVTATLALIVALGGTSYAAISLPANSVGAKQIKFNAVGTADIKNRSLLGRDFRRGELSLRGYEEVTTKGSAPAGGVGDERADCPAGKQVLGGGVLTSDSRNLFITNSGPFPSTDGLGSAWTGTVLNTKIGKETFTVYALCADVK